jgi:hypothetical protein
MRVTAARVAAALPAARGKKAAGREVMTLQAAR